MTQKKLPKRCQFRDCKKKLPLTKFMCKCEKYFCDIHRYQSEHDCTFNYKNPTNNEKIIEEMKCVQEKIVKV